MRKALTLALMLLSGMVACAQTDSLSADTLFYDDTVEYSAPKKNPIYYFGSPFCEHFLELRYTSGDDGLGLGAMYSYLPEVWGFNVSAFMMDYNYYWLSGGAAYRLSYDNSAIHQLHPTLEMGIRCASADGMGQFCITSGTLGVMTNFDGMYLTFGIGLSLTTARVSRHNW